MDDLDRMEHQANIANWRNCMTRPNCTAGEAKVLQKLIDDAETALQTGVIPEYNPPWK